MKLSTGKVAFPLYFDNGDVEKIYINPHDAGLQKRINGFQDSVRERMKKINLEKHKNAFSDSFNLQGMDFDKLMEMPQEDLEKITNQTSAILAISEELEKEFCEELDIIFDSDISKKAFKYVPPLALVENEDGECELYILLVLKALAVEIQKYGNKMNSATSKYVEKYPKKQ